MSKVFVDSDGVLHNLMKKLCELNPDAWYDHSVIEYLLANYPDEVFQGELMPGATFYLNELRTNPDWFVLTAVSSPERLEPFCEKYPVNEVLRRHIKGKYSWFEKFGVPKEKVIIVKDYRDKPKWCEPGDILYDDTKGNIDAWNKAGGTGIHVKQLWRP